MTPTYCDACDHVEPESRKRSARGWLCLKHPRLPGFNRFVTERQWDKDEPFLRCVEVNGGLCKLYEPKRDGQIALLPKESEYVAQ